MINEQVVMEYIQNEFDHVEESENFGYKFYFYKDDHTLSFATIALSDNEYDRVSNLDRPGVFRLNLGISRETFISLFGLHKVDVSQYDFTTLDTLMPHPDYAPQSFICVLNPSEATFELLKPMLAEAYDIAKKRYDRRAKTKK